MRVADLLLLCALAGCARAEAESVRAEEVPLPRASGGELAATPPTPPSRLTRAGLDEVVREGIGAFLATLEVSPAFSRGRFVGWRLDRARHLARWNAAGMTLSRGDVVTAVNGGSLERPDDALAVFNALRGAAELRVDLLRDGRPMTLRVAVE